MLPGFGEEYETLSGFRIKVQMSRIMLIMEFFFPPPPLSFLFVPPYMDSSVPKKDF